MSGKYSTANKRHPSGRAVRAFNRREAYGNGWKYRMIVGWLIAILTVAPFGWLVVTALKPAGETFRFNFAPVSLDNFIYVLTEVPIPRYMLNTALVAVTVTLVALWFHSMAAYPLARLRFRGRELLFNIVVATFMIALPVILVPLYMLTRTFGMLDSLLGVIIPMIFNAFGIFLLRQAMLSIPTELEDAARIDGCSYWRIYTSVVLPLVKPVLVSLGILFFLVNWNSFLWPRTILASKDIWMVQQGLQAMQGQFAADWNYVTAAAVIVAIPTLVLFFVGRRTLTESIKTSGLKG